MYDKDYVLEKVSKYDMVRTGKFFVRNSFSQITIQDVIDNETIEYGPECSPEYCAVFKDIGGRIMKIATDMSDFDNPQSVTFYPYLD